MSKRLNKPIGPKCVIELPCPMESSWTVKIKINVKENSPILTEKSIKIN